MHVNSFDNQANYGSASNVGEEALRNRVDLQNKEIATLKKSLHDAENELKQTLSKLSQNEIVYQKRYDELKNRNDGLDKEVQKLSSENFRQNERNNQLQKEKEVYKAELERAKGLVDKMHMEKIDL